MKVELDLDSLWALLTARPFKSNDEISKRSKGTLSILFLIWLFVLCSSKEFLAMVDKKEIKFDSFLPLTGVILIVGTFTLLSYPIVRKIVGWNESLREYLAVCLPASLLYSGIGWGLFKLLGSTSGYLLMLFLCLVGLPFYLTRVFRVAFKARQGLLLGFTLAMLALAVFFLSMNAIPSIQSSLEKPTKPAIQDKPST